MFEKNLRLSYLLDFYGEVLDEHIRSVMKAYYDDDLSLAEIAEGVGISRQGVRHLIKKGEDQLSFLEDRLGLAAREEGISLASDRLVALRDKLAFGTDIQKAVAELEEIIKIINNKL